MAEETVTAQNAVTAEEPDHRRTAGRTPTRPRAPASHAHEPSPRCPAGLLFCLIGAPAKPHSEGQFKRTAGKEAVPADPAITTASDDASACSIHWGSVRWCGEARVPLRAPGRDPR